jgi:hypothetical protein
MRPLKPLPVVMRWLKGSTVRSANLLLERTGKPFWKYESYDHCVRSSAELNRVIRYTERSPVRAGRARAYSTKRLLSFSFTSSSTNAASIAIKLV